MLITLKKLLDLLTPNERRRAALLLAMILIMALLDVVGVASIMPFMAVLANPKVIETNIILARIYATLGFKDAQSFMFFLGVTAFALLIVSIAFKGVTTYVQTRFVLMRGYSLILKLVKGYLRQPYAWFLNRNSADLGKTILSEVFEVVNSCMTPMMQLIAQGAVVCALIILLVVADPWLALVSGSFLGLAYLLIYVVMRSYLARLGAQRVAATEKMWQVISEAFGGIKEIKLGGLEEKYVKHFDKSLFLTIRSKAIVQVTPQVTRVLLELIVFGGMLLFILHLIASDGGISKALPILSLYAFAAYRLMPALQAVFGSLTQLRFAGTALDVLHSDIVALAPQRPADAHGAPIRLERCISLDAVTFTYNKAMQPALRDLNLRIPARSTVGMVGATGSGKTTTVDLILGLLEPDAGSLEVDGVPIDATNRRQWQRAIGYVPQQIYLADDTVAANIAFGLEPDQIDQGAVERSARIANLHDFVVNELPQGYVTTVGERGVRLSGGQRQRIGIARALYHNPQVLILDEATSALDNLTEQAVMEAMHNLGHEITIILIAHRLTTVRECDQIYMLRHGRVTAQGTYDQLIQGNEIFRAMAAHKG